MDGKIKVGKLLMEVFDLVVRSGVCPETRPSQWLSIISIAHQLGYLYCAFEKDELSSVALAYRIPDLEPFRFKAMPKKESGNILYIDWLVSRAKNKFKVRKMLKAYLRITPEITKIAFFKRNSDRNFKVYELKKGVQENVEIKVG